MDSVCQELKSKWGRRSNPKGEKFEELKDKCSKYTGPNYVYKKCEMNHVSWIVVMKKTPETKTNEGRKNVKDPDKAKFRANLLSVVEIFNIADPSITEKSISNTYCHKITVYEVGKDVRPDLFDENLEEVCTYGIHYFKTLEPAYFYMDPPPQYTGTAVEWFDDGAISSEGPVVCGLKHGEFTYRWNEGPICWIGTYENDLEQGKWYHFDIDGIKCVYIYNKGVRVEKYTD